MLSAFHSQTDTPFDQQASEPTRPDKSKIPFNFNGTPRSLHDNPALSLADIGFYDLLVNYLNFKSRVKVGKRVLLKGYTVVISQARLAERAKMSVRNVRRYIKRLIEAGELEVIKSYKGCLVYRLLAYKRAIEEIKAEQGKEEEKYTNPAAPDRETVEKFIRQDKEAARASQEVNSHIGEMRTGLSQLGSDLSHVKELLRNLTDEPPSSRTRAGENKNDAPDEPDDESWREYQKYAHAFYGEIKSKTFRKEVCLYFKGKVEEYGICDDGFDVVLEMIPVLLKAGARHHKAFDQPFGIDAFNQVMDERDKQKRLSHERERWEQQKRQESASQEGEKRQQGQEQSSSPDNKETDPSRDWKTDSANNERFDNEQQSSSGHVPPHRPKTAREAVARVLHARYCLIKIGIKEPYTDLEIEQMWEDAYQKYGGPQTVEEWVSDRIYVRQRLCEKKFVDFYSDSEIEELRRIAGERFGGF